MDIEKCLHLHIIESVSCLCRVFKGDLTKEHRQKDKRSCLSGETADNI